MLSYELVFALIITHASLRAVSFEQHLEDVIFLFRFFQQKSVQEESFSFLFFNFVLRRAYPKIRARAMNGQNMWGDHPIRIIQRWFQDPEKREGVESAQITITTSPIVVRKLLALDGIVPLDPEAEVPKIYSVSKYNAHNGGSMPASFT